MTHDPGVGLPSDLSCLKKTHLRTWTVQSYEDLSKGMVGRDMGEQEAERGRKREGAHWAPLTGLDHLALANSNDINASLLKSSLVAHQRSQSLSGNWH